MVISDAVSCADCIEKDAPQQLLKIVYFKFKHAEYFLILRGKTSIGKTEETILPEVQKREFLSHRLQLSKTLIRNNCEL